MARLHQDVTLYTNMSIVTTPTFAAVTTMKMTSYEMFTLTTANERDSLKVFDVCTVKADSYSVLWHKTDILHYVTLNSGLSTRRRTSGALERTKQIVFLVQLTRRTYNTARISRNNGWRSEIYRLQQSTHSTRHSTPTNQRVYIWPVDHQLDNSYSAALALLSGVSR